MEKYNTAWAMLSVWHTHTQLWNSKPYKNNKWEVLWIHNISNHRYSHLSTFSENWSGQQHNNKSQEERKCMHNMFGFIVLCTCVGVCGSDHYHRCTNPSSLSEPKTIVLRLSEDWRLVIHVLHVHNNLQRKLHNQSDSQQTHAATHTHTHYIQHFLLF